MPTIGDQHIVKSYDDALKQLHDSLARMAGLTEAQLHKSIEALEKRDSDIASQVMSADQEIDDVENFINDQTVRVLALRAPVADDLRQVISALKVAGDIERIADHAANAAKRSLVLNQLPPVAPMRSLVRMGKLVAELLGEVLNAYLTHDAERALAVRSRDQEVDDLYSSLFREILTYMMEDPRTITSCSHLMFIAKNIERVGDHATNIAEQTYFVATGRSLNDQRPKRDTSAFEGAVQE
ncbi:MAG: phosphate signaling complex protein PhoU [Magnetospirillum sp.]